MQNKQDLSNGLNKQVDKSYYFTKKYANLERFISYFYQIDLIRKSNAKNILFIGIGDNFENILNKLSKISKNVIISLPYRNSGLEIIIKFPFIRTLFKKDYFRLLLAFPIKFPGFKISGQHYWEIDNKNFKMKRIKSCTNKYFKIENIKKALLTPYKGFFIFKKNNNT